MWECLERKLCWLARSSAFIVNENATGGNYTILICDDLDAATNIAADFLDQEIQETDIDWMKILVSI